MSMPVELIRQLTEDKIEFVKRSGLKAEVLETGFVRLCLPETGNLNHVGSIYAGALFTLAEIPGGALFMTSFDVQRYYPIVKELNLRFRRPANGEIRVEALLGSDEIQRIQQQAEAEGKADYNLDLELTDAHGEVVAISKAVYQLRRHGQ